LDKLITVPFGYLLDWLNQLLGNYGLALIFFALVVQLVLLPITAKSKKSMMKMSRLAPKMQAIKEKYPNDQQKQNEAIQQLQREEGASLGCGGCLWSLVPMLILIPLYGVIRQPIQFMLHESAETAQAIVDVVKAGMPHLFNSQNTYYQEIIAAPHIAAYKDAILAAGIQVSERTLEGLLYLPGRGYGSDSQLDDLDLGRIHLESAGRRSVPHHLCRSAGAVHVHLPENQQLCCY